MATHNKEDQVETTDPFATAADSNETVADPFATEATPPAEPETPAEAVATPEPDSSSDIPTVDREGEPVDIVQPAADEATEYAETAQQAAAAANAEDAPEAATAAPAAPETEEAAPEPQTATDGGQEPPQDPPAAPASAPEAAAEVETPAETPGDAEAAEQAAVPPAEGGSGDAPASGGGDAPADDATANGPGKAAIRRYKLLYQTGPREWTEFDLDPQHAEFGSYVTVDDDGEKWMLARNNEHAKRIGFAILGRPKDGVLIFPVPSGSYKPSRVKPAPPRPEKERLVIE